MYSVFHTTITVPRVLPVYEWPLEFPIPHEIVFLEEWGKSGITISIPRGMGKWGNGEKAFFIPRGMRNKPFLLEDPQNSPKFLTV